MMTQYFPFESLFRDMNRLFSDFERDFLTEDITSSLMTMPSSEQKMKEKSEKGKRKSPQRFGVWWTGFPLMDIVDEGEEYVVHLDVPGVPKDKIKISIEEDMLTISGERSSEIHEHLGLTSEEKKKQPEMQKGQFQQMPQQQQQLGQGQQQLGQGQQQLGQGQQMPQQQQQQLQKGPESGQLSEEEMNKFLRWERHIGKFSRTIRLPTDVKRDEIKAKCEHGVLVICLPKVKAEQPRRESHMITVE